MKIKELDDIILNSSITLPMKKSAITEKYSDF